MQTAVISKQSQNQDLEGKSKPDHQGNKDEALVHCSRAHTHIPELYLLQDGVDPVHFAVDEEAFLLAAIHLLNDASELYGVHDVPHWASSYLPVVGYCRLHDGLEDGKTWRSRRPKLHQTLQKICDILLHVTPGIKQWQKTSCLSLCPKNWKVKNRIVHQYDIQNGFHPASLAAAVDELHDLTQVTHNLF